MHSLVGILIRVWIYVSSETWQLYCVKNKFREKMLLRLDFKKLMRQKPNQ